MYLLIFMVTFGNDLFVRFTSRVYRYEEKLYGCLSVMMDGL